MTVNSSDEEDQDNNQVPDKGEAAQSSIPVAQNAPVVEVG